MRSSAMYPRDFGRFVANQHLALLDPWFGNRSILIYGNHPVLDCTPYPTQKKISGSCALSSRPPSSHSRWIQRYLDVFHHHLIWAYLISVVVLKLGTLDIERDHERSNLQIKWKEPDPKEHNEFTIMGF